jgi:hypothetical protein
MTRALSLLSVPLLAACAPLPKPPPPESTRIELRLPLPKDQAYERTYVAFLAERLNIASGSRSSGALISVPLALGAVKSRVSEPILEPYSRKITYRADVLAQGDTSLVVLSGTIRDATFGASDPREELLDSQMRGALHDAWHRLERIAARLRGEPPQ